VIVPNLCLSLEIAYPQPHHWLDGRWRWILYYCAYTYHY